MGATRRFGFSLPLSNSGSHTFAHAALETRALAAIDCSARVMAAETVSGSMSISVTFSSFSIPTISQSTTNTAAATTLSGYNTSSITQQEVGIKITVKPLIGNDGSVQLDLKQEISDVGPEVTIDNNKQNVILKRTTSSFITAKSGEILVLGGLQKKSNKKSTNRLGPIPILGDLLGSRSRSEERTELVFFLRPIVLTNTVADNSEAYKRLEELPKKPREEVKQELGLPHSP